MDNRDEVKAFLSSRQAKITPAQAGPTSYRRARRVPVERLNALRPAAGARHDDANMAPIDR